MRARRTDSLAAFDLVTLEDRTLPAAPFHTLPVVPIIDGETYAHIREVAALGRAQGQRENVLAKVGDSISAQYSQFLIPFGKPGYNPVASGLAALRPDLVPVWQTYLAPAGPGGENSYVRTSFSAQPGRSGRDMLSQTAAEIDAMHPAINLIEIGTNDWSYDNAVEYFRDTLRQVVQTNLDRGVVPVVSTIPEINLFNGNLRGWVQAANQVIADVADEMDVPLWNYWRAMQGLPFDGLADGLHPNVAPQGGAYYGPGWSLYGFNIRNLTALDVLKKVRGVAFGTALPDGYAVPEPLPWSALNAGESVIAVGAPAGYPPVVQVNDAETGAVLTRFLAFEGGFAGGVRVAVADVNDDGVSDVIAAAGPGGGPAVKAYSGIDGHELLSYFAYEPTFTGGVSVAVGDVDGDGRPDIVTGAGPGGGPRVRAVRVSDLAPLADFMAFDPKFVGGVTVAVGNFGASLGSAIAVGPGVGGGGVVAYFDGSGRVVANQLAFDPNYRGGVSVAAGDLTGDGFAEVVVGALTGSTRVVAMNGNGDELASFFAEGRSRNGVRVGTSSGRIVTGTANPTRAVRGFDAGGKLLNILAGSAEPYFQAGPFVGG